uniref:Tumor suppressor candidate 2 n=1 Tax=Trichuris muris TaxID=70415 RepID=A0A5S6Q098_TRIMR
MGHAVSKLFHRNVGNETNPGKHLVSAAQPPAIQCSPITAWQNPLVTYRRGSMYFDEDGELAHEFYVESTTKTGRHTVLQKVPLWKLVPQGMVAHEFPRLDSRLSTVMVELRKATGQ